MSPLRSGTYSETKVAPRLVTLAWIPEGCAMVISETKFASAVVPKSVTAAVWLPRLFEDGPDMESLIMPRDA